MNFVFIIRNLNYILVAFAIILTVWDFLKKYAFPQTQKSTEDWAKSIKNRVDLVILLTSTYVLTSTINSVILTNNNENLLPPSVNFYDQLLRNRIEFVKQGIKNGKIVFDNESESIYQLLKVIDNAKNSYEAINTYTEGWKREIDSLSDASIAAVDREVEVSRCFILKNTYFQEELESQYQEMKKQTEGGIEVFYVEESELQKIPFFRDNNLRSMALVDSILLVTDTSPVGATGKITSITISWNEEEVSKNPFKRLKTYRKKFDANTFMDLAKNKLTIK